MRFARWLAEARAHCLRHARVPLHKSPITLHADPIDGLFFTCAVCEEKGPGVDLRYLRDDDRWSRLANLRLPELREVLPWTPSTFFAITLHCEGPTNTRDPKVAAFALGTYPWTPTRDEDGALVWPGDLRIGSRIRNPGAGVACTLLDATWEGGEPFPLLPVMTAYDLLG